jgi:hypothetical protein
MTARTKIVAKIVVVVLGIANILLYFTSGSGLFLGIGVLLICGGIVIIGYIENPADFHARIRLFRRNRD